jgi:hypothetical protein
MHRIAVPDDVAPCLRLLRVLFQDAQDAEEVPLLVERVLWLADAGPHQAAAASAVLIPGYEQ